MALTHEDKLWINEKLEELAVRLERRFDVAEKRDLGFLSLINAIDTQLMLSAQQERAKELVRQKSGRRSAARRRSV